MKKINLAIFGTRPEVIKMFPLFRKMPFIIINTGQQRELSKMMLDLFNIVPDIDLDLMKKNQSICGFLSRAIKELDKVVKSQKVDRIWVQGDTMSALAGALVAKMNKIELVHLEAGLRTFDDTNPFPEEFNRILIDQIADILFVPTYQNLENLKREHVKGEMYLVGNTVVDSLNIIRKKCIKGTPCPFKYVLATVHRRETIGKEMEEIFKALKELNKEIVVILPIHPNPNVRRLAKKVGLQTISPLYYVDFLRFLKYCEYVISDSGGVTEEAASFGKKVIILRRKTERQEAINAGYATLIDKMECNHILKKIKEFFEKKVNITKNVFGDGHAVDKIIKIIKKLDGK
jgi:UDP-N-acetylglucosamine 2-epimerase (non-hydrolysing)